MPASRRPGRRSSLPKRTGTRRSTPTSRAPGWWRGRRVDAWSLTSAGHDRQHRVDPRPAGRGQRRCVRHVQSWSPTADQSARTRMGAPRDPRQRDRTRLHRDRPEPGVLRERARAGDHQADPATPPRAARRSRWRSASARLRRVALHHRERDHRRWRPPRQLTLRCCPSGRRKRSDKDKLGGLTFGWEHRASIHPSTRVLETIRTTICVYLGD